MSNPEPECALTELPVSMCAHCHPPVDEPDEKPLHWFAANFPGRCADCGNNIEPGDSIAHTDDGYVCECRR